MDNPEDLFKKVDDYRLRAHGYDGLDESFTLEELYAAFMTRMNREIKEYCESADIERKDATIAAQSTDPDKAE